MKQTVRTFENILHHIIDLVKKDTDKEKVLSELFLFANTLNALARCPILNCTETSIRKEYLAIEKGLTKINKNTLEYSYLKGRLDTYKEILCLIG